MPDPARRRVRVRVLDALARAPAPVSRGLLRALSAPARFSVHERRTRANLALALGATTSSSERARIARGVRRHAARQLFEWTRLARARLSAAERGRTLAWLSELVELDPSIERLHAAAARARGCILVTAHLGNWELLAAALRRHGLQGVVIGYHKPRDPTAEWLVSMRGGVGLETVPQGASPRRLIDLLRAGIHVGLLADLEARRLASEVVPFFGHPALTMIAPASLARAARAPVVPVRCVAEGTRYRLSVDEPLELDPRLGRREAAIDLATRLNALFERWIRATPEQWAWHQKRWRAPEELAPAALAGRPGFLARA